MGSPIEVATEDRLEYNFFPNSSGVQQFRVRAPNDAHIALTQGPQESDPMYEIFLGGWGNTKSVIRKNRTKPDVVEVNTPGILNAGEFRGFWIRWSGPNITVGREGDSSPLLSWYDPGPPVNINYVGVCTGWGATGSWILEQAYGAAPQYGGPQAQAYTAPPQGGGGGPQCWVPASNGSVPPGAFQGGEDRGEPVFVARANYQGALIPGKLVPSHGVCYVPWGGNENPVPQYEVLVGSRGVWVPSSGGSIPPGAIPAGQTESGEPLYVGRVSHEGSVTTGKVQPSHNVLYIPYGGQELSFQNFEILVG